MRSAASTSWYRHITLVLLALADFAGICATERFSTSPPAPSPLPAGPAVLALTVPEVRHLLARLIWPSPSSASQVLAWSWWRRSHHSRASSSHTKRRLKAGCSWLARRRTAPGFMLDSTAPNSQLSKKFPGSAGVPGNLGTSDLLKHFPRKEFSV
jgi:hypothetical protein